MQITTMAMKEGRLHVKLAVTLSAQTYGLKSSNLETDLSDLDFMQSLFSELVNRVHIIKRLTNRKFHNKRTIVYFIT